MRTTDIALLIKAHDYRFQTFEEGVYDVLGSVGLRDDQAAHFYAVLVERCPKGKLTPTGELEQVLTHARKTCPQ
jgi:hypothetical protein